MIYIADQQPVNSRSPVQGKAPAVLVKELHGRSESSIT